jgi:hypothetical protein
MQNIPLPWRIAAVVGVIVGAWTSNSVAEYRAQAWANAPVENWTGSFKATRQQLNELHAREQALHAGDGQQQQSSIKENPSHKENPSQLDAP